MNTARKRELQRELIRFLDSRELDETEASLLTEWVESGHSVYTNPAEQYDDYGNELPYMKWYWMKQDPRHIGNVKRDLIEAMTLPETIPTDRKSIKNLLWAQRILRDEIILYRRFLAEHSGGVPAFETYRKGIIGDWHD